MLYPLTSILDRLDLGTLFPQAQPLEVELGSGDGSFLIRYAQVYPERNFIGVERLLGRLQKIDRKARRAGLANVREIRIESAYFLQYLLPAHSVSALHIYFPDPWPKRKHLRHRLINDAFPTLARQALVPGGAVFLRTDHPGYFDQMAAVFAAAPAFSLMETPKELASVLTDFEESFQAQGVPTLRAAYRCAA